MQDQGAAAPVVLIVEDDARIAKFMAKGLRATGFTPEWVPTGFEALARIAVGGVAVQILDLGLPDTDGLVLLRELTSRGAVLPTVVVTARTDPRDREAALALGVRAYITKPFPFAKLVAAVRDCVDGEAG